MEDTVAIGFGIAYIVLVATLIAGWIMNIMTIWNTYDLPLTGKLVLRVIGVFVFPIGGVLGYL